MPKSGPLHHGLLAQDQITRQSEAEPFDTEQLIEAFAPLAEWAYWTREQKRSVLASLVPDIRLADYEIQSLGLSPIIFSGEVTRTDRGYLIMTPKRIYLPFDLSILFYSYLRFSLIGLLSSVDHPSLRLGKLCAGS
jgi:hypothetical protein